MKKLGAVLVAAVVLTLAAIFAVQTGAMKPITEFAAEVFGKPVGEAIGGYGEHANDVWNGDAKPEIPDLSGVLPSIPAPTEQRIPTYKRDAFGQAWADVDGNHCDTRNDMLARDLVDVQKQGSCTVLKGTLHDPYTGRDISFARGKTTSAAVQIDHVVPLSLAWRMGAYAWSPEQRLQYANDPFVLQAADGPSNSAKGDKGPSAWMPSNKAYGCEYMSRFTAITVKYGLAMQDADRAFIEKNTVGCAR